MKIHLRDLNAALVTAWCDWIGNSRVSFTAVDGAVGDPADAGATAVVSPANSFGIMDGGIDLSYARRWTGIEDAVRARIARECLFSELLVGQAIFVPIPGASATKSLIVAPTMRVPMRIIDPADVYLATRVAVRCAQEHNVDSLAIPGMGTGCGGVAPTVAAHAMMQGIMHALGAAPRPESMGEASRLHWEFQRR